MRLLAPLVAFVFFVPFDNALGRELTTSTAFTTLSLIAMLNQPVGTLLRTIPSLKAGMACFERIQTYLKSESRQIHVLALNDPSTSSSSGKYPVSIIEMDVEPDQNILLEDLQSKPQGYSEMVIDVRNASFGWSRTATPQINDVTFSVHRGNFVFILGPVGCGKSTLLKGLMSETPSLKGFVYGNTLESAFSDQTPWIQNTTIRQNIVGVSAFDKTWYTEVIAACALDYDIAALPDSHGMYPRSAISQPLINLY
jgi:ATP-binding cassette subfamily C (CFTR/MRP) protein 1